MAAPAEYRIRAVQRRVVTLEEAEIHAQLRILRATRRDILAALVDAKGFERWRLQELLQVVDREIGLGLQLVQTSLERAISGAFGHGLDLARLVVPSPTLAGVSPELLRSIISVTQDQTRDVWRELGSRLKTIIRRAAIGVQDSYSAMRALARLIRDPKTFGRAFWRAEAIVRTEVSRTFSLAGFSEMGRAAQAGVKVGKYWLHSGRTIHPRPEHIEAGKVYGPDSAIAWDKAFLVGGERLMYPLDPSASAENTINCGCTAVPVVLD